MRHQQTNTEFKSTRWSLVDRLRDGNAANQRTALDDLAKLYWPAVYGYLRRRQLGREAAEEATQAFFTDVVIGRSLFSAASPDRGRLRTLILSALKNYQIDQSRRRSARGGASTLRLDPSQIEREERTVRQGDASVGGPEAEFDRRWAAAQVEEAVRRCCDHFEKSGRAGHWKLFEERVLGPSVRFTTPPPLAELATRLGWSSANDAGAALQVVRKRFDVVLREVVSEASSDDPEGEYRLVMQCLR